MEEDAERGRYMQNLSKTRGKKDTKLKSEWVTFLIKIIAHGPERQKYPASSERHSRRPKALLFLWLQDISTLIKKSFLPTGCVKMFPCLSLTCCDRSHGKSVPN